MTDLAVNHDRLRPLMFSIAYRMLGSVAEAEDVVQEAFLKMHRSAMAGTEPKSPDAFATTVTTRLAIDALRTARRRREDYIGTWLPEPLLADDADPAHRIGTDESVSIAFLAVLERLTPLERAVYLLREVFGYDYAAIADVVERTEANCRQLLTRARKHIEEAKPRFDPSPERRTDLARAFFAALRGQDLDGLTRLLAADAVFYGDGGGKAPAIRQPMLGAAAVARFLVGLTRRGADLHVRVEPTLANGQPAARLLDEHGAVLGVLMLEIVGGQIIALRNQINPDKLGHLGAVGDMSALLAAAAPSR